MLGISPAHFYRQVKAGHIEVTKNGRRTLVHQAELARYASALPTRSGPCR
jgi:excisionase family DNA binding protein